MIRKLAYFLIVVFVISLVLSIISIVLAFTNIGSWVSISAPIMSLLLGLVLLEIDNRLTNLEQGNNTASKDVSTISLLKEERENKNINEMTIEELDREIKESERKIKELNND